MVRTRITLQGTPVKGAAIEVRTLIAHAMETGYRPGADGQVQPRNLIRRFRCMFDDGKTSAMVFSAELHPAIAANPYLAFYFPPPGDGQLHFVWEGDNGFAQTEVLAIQVAT